MESKKGQWMSFFPGLELSEQFYRTAVAPLMAKHAPDLPYAAGLFGPGSEVLGFDTQRSTDHDWGPRLILLLQPSDMQAWGDHLNELFRRELPPTIVGFPTSFVLSESEDGIAILNDSAPDAPIEHRVRIMSAENWLKDHLGIPSVKDISVATWLTLSEQRLLETTSGRIFRDDIGTISSIRRALSWYPDDVWRYRMAAQWKRIDQLEPFVGRCGEVGDDLGSHLIAMTLVRDVMKLAFLQERRYAPYPKWFGSAFAQLDPAAQLAPSLDAARYATAWQAREAGVLAAQLVLAKRHNAMGLTDWIDPTPTTFFSRPFQVLFGGRFSDALLGQIDNPTLRALPNYLGGIDQYIDSTDAMNSLDLHAAIRGWIEDSSG